MFAGVPALQRFLRPPPIPLRPLPGLPTDFEARRAHSLGLQLVIDLARQIGGRLEIGPGPGAGFTMIFAPTRRATAALLP